MKQTSDWLEAVKGAWASYHVFIIVAVVVGVTGDGVAVSHQVPHGAAEGTRHCREETLEDQLTRTRARTHTHTHTHTRTQ